MKSFKVTLTETNTYTQNVVAEDERAARSKVVAEFAASPEHFSADTTEVTALEVEAT